MRAVGLGMTADDDSVRISSESFSLVGRVRRRLARLLETPGIPLDPYTRRLVERRFEQEFSRVCLHVNSAAAECAALLHAEAFTVHDHIAFAAGAYAPDTDAGLRLLSHELTHVVQNRQRRGHQRPASSSVYLAAEREAESISERVMSGLSATGIRGVCAPIALTASSAAIERLISRAWTDWIVTMNEQVAVLAVVRTDTDLPSTIRDLGSTMRYALFERIWGNNHRRALVQMLGGGSDSATAPMVRTNVMSMTPFSA